MVIGKQIFQFL